MKKLLIYLAAMAALCGCRDSEVALAAMDTADSLMQTAPDSALTILNGIKPRALHSAEGKARYGLLKSMALDKNFVDTTDFRVLQPAIDYYLNEGTPDQRLRTLYYQGRIYMNQGDNEAAMQSFFEALDLKDEATDQRTVALALIAQGSMYLDQYQSKEYLKNNIEAAKIWSKLGDRHEEIGCLAKAINGCVLEDDKELAYELLLNCDSLVELYPDGTPLYISSLISYVVNFGGNSEIKELLDFYWNKELLYEDVLTVADGYNKIGESKKALSILTDINLRPILSDTLRCTIIKMEVMDSMQRYADEVVLFKEYLSLISKQDRKLFEQDLLFAENRYKLNVENLQISQSRDRLIELLIGLGLTLVSMILWLYYRYKYVKQRRLAIEKENENLLLEQELLKLKKEKLELDLINKEEEAENLEKENQRLESDKHHYQSQAEALRQDLSKLEQERDALANLLEQRQAEFDESIRSVIKKRLDLLNGLLAKEITKNDRYAKPLEKWLEDREEFMNSTRLAYAVLYPKFIEFLESKGLEVSEINYLCLYVIGLRGKEVGEYINLKGHYNISSVIRNKLGIDEHETNIGLYIRRLLKTFE